MRIKERIELFFDPSLSSSRKFREDQIVLNGSLREYYSRGRRIMRWSPEDSLLELGTFDPSTRGSPIEGTEISTINRRLKLCLHIFYSSVSDDRLRGIDGFYVWVACHGFWLKFPARYMTGLTKEEHHRFPFYLRDKEFWFEPPLIIRNSRPVVSIDSILRYEEGKLKKIKVWAPTRRWGRGRLEERAAFYTCFARFYGAEERDIEKLKKRLSTMYFDHMMGG